MALRGTTSSGLLKHRIHLMFWLILIAYLLMIVRLLYLQGVVGPELREQAIESRQREVKIKPQRGSIYDRNETLLAVSRFSGTVSFDPMQVYHPEKPIRQREKDEKSLQEAIPQVATLLQRPVAEVDAELQQAIQHHLAGQKVRYVPLKKDVSLETALELRKFAYARLGFGVVEDYKRVYPLGESAMQIVGFLKPDGAGAAGLERGCGPQLTGKPGVAEFEVDHKQRELPNTNTRLLPAVDGFDVLTTLDANAQYIAMQEAKKCFEKYRPDGISVVIVEPETGDLLALVSMPTFDPNPGGREGRTSAEIEQSLFERCASLVYEPGSTLKTLTIAAALDQGIISTDSYFYCSGTLKIGKRSLRCDRHGGSGVHGSQNVTDILRKSCNVCSSQIGLRMGAKRLYAAEEAFGLFSPLPLPLPIQQRGFLSHDRRHIENINNPGKVARVAFGHAITTTPVHVAMAYAAIANNGVLMQPRLVRAMRDAKGTLRDKNDPKPVRRVISEQTAAAMRAMLAEVVTNGTGKIAAVKGYRVAGKTGTANKYKKGMYIGSFVGFLPASAAATPKAVILVAVDVPKGAYYGAEVAAPVFQAIARRLMDTWHVPQDDPQGEQYRMAHERLKLQRRGLEETARAR